ncbi:MAG: hypothetical protein M3R61_00975, partial [Chloroflexota bacterium]|nr:hypothetical protein [Chloroflexota bacterium]
MGIPIVDLVDKMAKFQGQEEPLYLGKYIDLLNSSYILTTHSIPIATSINLLSIPDPMFVAKIPATQPLDLLDDVRNGLTLNSPSRIDLPMLLPANNMNLQFSVGLQQAQWSQGQAIRFSILVTDGQG